MNTKKIFAIWLGLVLQFSISARGYGQTDYATSEAGGGSVSTNSALTPETKAFLIICGYGTVGGALLGLASLAFNGEARNIAKGASLGLYAGILFGAYVIYSHESSAPSRYGPPGEGEYDYGAGAPGGDFSWRHEFPESTLEISSSEFLADAQSTAATDKWILPLLSYQF